MKKNLKPQYHTLLTKVGKIVDETVDDHLEESSYLSFPEKRRMYSPMLERKRGTQKLRGMAACLALSAYSGLEVVRDERAKRILAAVELENYSNYALNWGFDGKAGVKDDKSQEESILAAFGFLNEAIEIVEDMPEISRLIRKYNHRVHRGWTPEVYDLHLDNLETMGDFEKFRRAYKIRNIEAGGQFYENYVAIADIFSGRKDDQLRERLGEIYKDFGEHIQIINDLGDFAKINKKWVSEKDSSDQLSDMRNNVVTWPTWLMYNGGDEKDREFMRTISSVKELDGLTKGRISSLFYAHAYDPICKQLRSKRLQLQGDLRRLEGINPEARDLAKVMVSMISSNKILYRLNQGRSNNG